MTPRGELWLAVVIFCASMALFAGTLLARMGWL